MKTKLATRLVPLMAAVLLLGTLWVSSPGSAQDMMSDATTSPTQEVVPPPIADPDLAAVGEPISEEEQNTALNEAELRRLLAEDTAFVYDHEGLRDPMLLPWVYYIAKAQAFLTEANAAISARDFTEAEKALTGVAKTAAEMTEAGYNLPAVHAAVKKSVEIRAQLVDVRAREGAVAVANDDESVEAQLPPWIEMNMRAVIWSGNSGTCMVGDYVLREGDEVPGQPVKVYVDKISEETVVFRVKDKRFPVTVRTFEEGE